MLRQMGLRVGELAKRTGLTVRTLHWYDEIGLLSPSAHTEAGHRLYTDRDVVRLQQIASLRQLGLSLEEIRACLEQPAFSLLEAIELQAARLREQLAAQRELCQRLEAIATGLRRTGEVSIETLMHTMEAMKMVEQYYTPEQLAYLKQRREQAGEARIREVEAEWPKLMDEVRAEMANGTDPTSEPVLVLARRWQGLVDEFTGGDPGIERSLSQMYQQESTIHGMDIGSMRPMMAYIGQAIEAIRQQR